MWIILLGVVVRLLFVFVGGRYYYGRPDYFIHGDTTSWFQAFINLFEHGTFTVSPDVEAGKFFRPPGYSFLFGFFYLITFENYTLAWKLLVAAQVIMDIASIYLISRISKSVFKNGSTEQINSFSNLSALLYALYPTAIVFAPLLHAETASIFFLLLSILFAFKPVSLKNIFLSGAFAGIATLTRLQCGFIIPFILVAFLSTNANYFREKIKFALMFCFAVGITYGLWPARNILLQHRIVFSQDIHIGRHWSEDFIAFLDFTHSISTDHTPFYFSILKNEKVQWPASAYIDPGDSMLLDSAVNMCRTCSGGFAHWKFGEHLVPKLELPTQPCDSQLAALFITLTEKQKTKHAFHYWITIPLMNLEKCFFKISVYGNKSFLLKVLSGFLLIIRSLLVVLGFSGIYLAHKKNLLNKNFLLIVFGFAISWYLYISFVHRNIEMRYLIQADILLLIPAAFGIMNLFFNKYLKQYEIKI